MEWLLTNFNWFIQLIWQYRNWWWKSVPDKRSVCFQFTFQRYNFYNFLFICVTYLRAIQWYKNTWW